jgi:hypothetical protein
MVQSAALARASKLSRNKDSAGGFGSADEPAANQELSTLKTYFENSDHY